MVTYKAITIFISASYIILKASLIRLNYVFFIAYELYVNICTTTGSSNSRVPELEGRNADKITLVEALRCHQNVKKQITWYMIQAYLTKRNKKSRRR